MERQVLPILRKTNDAGIFMLIYDVQVLLMHASIDHILQQLEFTFCLIIKRIEGDIYCVVSNHGAKYAVSFSSTMAFWWFLDQFPPNGNSHC